MLVVSTLKLVPSSLEQNHKLRGISEWFELYSIRLYIGITKSESSASSIVVPSIFMVYLMNGAQFLNSTWVTLCPLRMMTPLNKM